MKRTRIKICGIMRDEDIALAAELGVEALGLNFFAGPRRLPLDRGRELVESSGLSKQQFVGLTRRVAEPLGGAPSALQIASAVGISTFQIYGPEEAEAQERGRAAGLQLWVVMGVSSRESLGGVRGAVGAFAPVAVVLDTAVKGQLGGTGKTFDWRWVAEARAAGELDGVGAVVLAGGLTPENVGEAIRVVRPDVVDVSSGVESGRPGVKDPARMRAFVEAVRSADAAGG